MQPISAAFAAAIQAGGYRVATLAQVLSNGMVVAQAPVMNGRITADRASDIRRRVSITVSAANNSAMVPPSTGGSGVGVYGDELSVAAGWINPATNAPELVPLGVFVIETVDVVDTGVDLAVTITGYDRAYSIGLRGFRHPYTVAAGSNAGASIQSLIASVAPPQPALAYNITPTSLTLPAAAVFHQGDNPWSAALTLATAGGMELFFDVVGTVVGRPIPVPGASVWTYNEGGGGPKSLARKLSRQGIANDFFVSNTGSALSTTNPLIQSEAADNDPSSPTYVSGPFGRVPKFIRSSLVGNAAEASTAASNMLAMAKGSVEMLTITVPPNYALDVDDVVTVTRQRANVGGNWVVDSLTHILSAAGTTTLSLRRVL